MTDLKKDNQATPQTRDEVNPTLLEILVCPMTKQPLSYDREASELISTKANLAFPIRNGIPIMLIEEARDLSDE